MSSLLASTFEAPVDAGLGVGAGLVGIGSAAPPRRFPGLGPRDGRVARGYLRAIRGQPGTLALEGVQRAS